MSTVTLLLVVGGVVCLKTVAFVAFLVRRGRRQQSALDAAAQAVRVAQAAEAALVAQPTDPAGWRLQWAEPGVLLVQNTSDAVTYPSTNRARPSAAPDDSRRCSHAGETAAGSRPRTTRAT